MTVIQAGPCDVLQVRTEERDGYEAVQLGFADKPRRLASRSERGHVAKLDSKRSKKRSAAGVELLAKAGCEPKRFIREIRGPAGELAVGGQDQGRSARRREVRRRHGHLQGPRLYRRHASGTISPASGPRTA